MQNPDPEQWQPEPKPNEAPEPQIKSYYDVNPEAARVFDMLLLADKNGNMAKAWRGIAGEIGTTGKDLLPAVWRDRRNLDTDDDMFAFKDIMGYFHEIRVAVNQAIAANKITRGQRREKIRELMNKPIMIEVKI